MTDSIPHPEIEKEKRRHVVKEQFVALHAFSNRMDDVTKRIDAGESLTIADAQELLETCALHVQKSSDSQSLPGVLFEQLLPDYAEHDLNNIRQGFGMAELLLLEHDDVLIKQEAWEALVDSWYRYELVIEDLAARYIDKESVDKSTIHETSLDLVWSELIPYVEKKAREHSIDIAFDVTEEAKEVILNINAGVLFNKLKNIIGNPIEKNDSTLSRSVRVSALVENGELVIQIQDDGKGIPENVQTEIFKEGFTNTGGLGLGLAYADSQIRSMGGSIVFDTTPVPIDEAGNGEMHTTFTVKFPIMKNV